MTLLQIYHCLCNWKNSENRSTFGEVTDKSIVGCFFDSQCTIKCHGWQRKYTHVNICVHIISMTEEMTWLWECRELLSQSCSRTCVVKRTHYQFDDSSFAIDRPNKSISDVYSGLSSHVTARTTMDVTEIMSQNNVWEWLLEQSKLLLLPEGWQWSGWRDNVR